jgi:hypothetical protein
MIHTCFRATYAISTDPSLLGLDAFHDYLRRSYWSPGIPRAVVETASANSLNFGLYLEQVERQRQVGFARVVTDYATYEYRFFAIECDQSATHLDGIDNLGSAPTPFAGEAGASHVSFPTKG